MSATNCIVTAFKESLSLKYRTGPYVMGSIQGDAYVVVPKDPYAAAGCQEMALFRK